MNYLDTHDFRIRVATFSSGHSGRVDGILDTSAVPIISPAAVNDIHKHLSHRIVPSRHVYREKPGEGIGAVSKAKCRWCVLDHRDPDIRQLDRSSPTPQTFSIYIFLFVAAVLQREVTLGVSSQRSCRVTRMCPKGHRASFTQVFHLEASLLPTGPGWRKVLWSNSTLLCVGLAMLRPSGGRRSCVALRALATEGHAATPAFCA